MMGFAGRHHKKDTIGSIPLSARLNGPFHRLFANRNGGDFNVVYQMFHFFAGLEQLGQFIRVFKLRHSLRVSEIGCFNPFKPRQNQLFSHPQLGLGGNKFFFVLKTVSDGNVT